MRLPLTLLLLLTAAGASAAFEPEWLRAVANDDTSTLLRLMPAIDDLDRSTAKGKTALMSAARGGDARLAEALIRAGAEVKQENAAAGTALIYAAWSGDLTIIDLLVDHGARVDHRAANGWTALMMAAAKRHPDAIRTLLSRDASADLPDVYGWTPLMRAAYEGHRAVVDRLLDHAELDLGRTNDQGQTALHLAVIGHHGEIARRLLSRGASPTAPDFKGRSPIELARVTDQAQLGDYLENQGNQH